MSNLPPYDDEMRFDDIPEEPVWMRAEPPIEMPYTDPVLPPDLEDEPFSLSAAPANVQEQAHVLVLQNKDAADYRIVGMVDRYNLENDAHTVSALTVADHLDELRASEIALQIGVDFAAARSDEPATDFKPWLSAEMGSLKAENPDLADHINSEAGWQTFSGEKADKALARAEGQTFMADGEEVFQRQQRSDDPLAHDLYGSPDHVPVDFQLTVEGVYNSSGSLQTYRSVAYDVYRHKASDTLVGRALVLGEEADFDEAHSIGFGIQADAFANERIPDREFPAYVEDAAARHARLHQQPVPEWQPMSERQMEQYQIVSESPHIYEPPQILLPDEPLPIPTAPDVPPAWSFSHHQSVTRDPADLGDDPPLREMLDPDFDPDEDDRWGQPLTSPGETEDWVKAAMDRLQPAEPASGEMAVEDGGQPEQVKAFMGVRGVYSEHGTLEAYETVCFNFHRDPATGENQDTLLVVGRHDDFGKAFWEGEGFHESIYLTKEARVEDLPGDALAYARQQHPDQAHQFQPMTPSDYALVKQIEEHDHVYIPPVFREDNPADFAVTGDHLVQELEARAFTRDERIEVMSAERDGSLSYGVEAFRAEQDQSTGEVVVRSLPLAENFTDYEAAKERQQAFQDSMLDNAFEGRNFQQQVEALYAQEHAAAPQWQTLNDSDTQAYLQYIKPDDAPILPVTSAQEPLDRLFEPDKEPGFYTAIRDMGIDPEPFNPFINPPAVEKEDGTAAWVGVFKPEQPDGQDYAVSSVFVIYPQAEGQWGAMLAPCTDGSFDKAMTDAGSLLRVVEETRSFDHLMAAAEGMARQDDLHREWQTDQGIPVAIEVDAQAETFDFAWGDR